MIAHWAVLSFISLPQRSMWETICDAQAGFCTLTSNSTFLQGVYGD